MDPLELNRMIERAKAEATATGASAPHKDTLGESLGGEIPKEAKSKAEELAAQLDQAVEDEEAEAVLEKRAAEERRGHMYIAKLLTALDVMSTAQNEG